MIVRMSAVLNSNVFDHPCRSDHQSQLPVRESSKEFFLTLMMMTSAQVVKGSVWSTALFRATLSRPTNDRIRWFKPLTTSRTLILSSSLVSLTGLKKRIGLKCRKKRIGEANGLLWLNCLFKTQKMKANPSLC